jgi:hypothetical protein
LKNVDVYSSIPRLIGGSGVALTALICDSFSDVARILEEKYIFDDFHFYFKNLEELTNNTEKRIDTMIAQNLYLNRYSEKEVQEITSKKLICAKKIFYKHIQS